MNSLHFHKHFSKRLLVSLVVANDNASSKTVQLWKNHGSKLLAFQEHACSIQYLLLTLPQVLHYQYLSQFTMHCLSALQTVIVFYSVCKLLKVISFMLIQLVCNGHDYLHVTRGPLSLLLIINSNLFPFYPIIRKFLFIWNSY